MKTPLRHPLFAMVAFLLLAAIGDLRAQQPLAARQAANTWVSGTLAETQTTNCASVILGTPTTEYGIGAYVSYLTDPAAGLPKAGTVFYLSVYMAGVGNPCSGTKVLVDLQLPAGTSLAVSVQNPIVYYYDNVALSAGESPQTLSGSSWNSGAYLIASPNSDKLWPLAQGHNFEFLVPVVASTGLSGSVFQANLQGIDGYLNQWIRPTVNVFVGAGTPSITYPTPSTTAITGTTAHSVANLYAAGLAGTAWFDLGTTTSYGLIHESVAIGTAGGPNFQVFDDWSPLSPGTTYHWRVTFTPSSGPTYYGADQTFTTTGSTSTGPRPTGIVDHVGWKATDALGRLRAGSASRDGHPPAGLELRFDPAGGSAAGVVQVR